MSDRQLRHRPTKIPHAPPSLEDDPDDGSNLSTPPASPKKKPPPKKPRITDDHSTAPAPPLNHPPVQPDASPTPVFHPIAPKAPTHSAYNTLPFAIKDLHGVEPVDILNLFLTKSLLETMSANTNAYAAEKIAEGDKEGGRTWKEVTAAELGGWIGIVIYMGVHCSPALADYWAHRNGLNPKHPTSDYMSQTHFEQVKRYFHVAAPDIPKETPKKRQLWHGKVDPILEQLRKSSQAYCVPSTNISIDEAMIRCTGRSKDTYKMPNKPIGRGFKFHCLADHGYVWDFHPTSNQCGPDPVPSIEGLTATGEVVYHLCSKLPRARYWVVYLDNFYTSVPLLARLRHDFKMGGCGTSRPSAAGFPKELKIPKSEVGKHEYHSTKITVLFDSIFRMAVGFLLRIDNAPVSMMTTVHDLNKTVQRLRKKPGKKSSNAKAALENFEENDYEKEMPIPVCVDDYNHHMGGVDQADQLRSYYDTQIIAF
jgi:hypothetical protein